MTVQQQQPPRGASREAASSSAEGGGFLRSEHGARILPFAVYMAFIAIADVLARAGLTTDQMRWLYPVKIAAVVVVLYAYRRYYSELVWRTMTLRGVVASVVTGMIVLILWINLDAEWMQVGVADGFDPRGPSGQPDWTLIVCRIAGAALVVPVMEELFWRSFLMRWIADPAFLGVSPARVGLKAVAITVLLFGVEHNLWFAGVVAGIFYTVLYMRTGNLWAPILAHAVTNAVLGAWVLATGEWKYW